MDAVSAVMPISDARVHVEPLVVAVTVALGVAIAGLAVGRLLAGATRAVMFAAVGAIGLVVTTELAKRVVSRRAIEGGGDESFPSGTAAWILGAALVCVLLLPANRRRAAAIAAAVLALAFAVIIVWERWHYPSDVLGGWLLAVGWVGAAWALLTSERERQGRPLGELPPDRE